MYTGGMQYTVGGKPEQTWAMQAHNIT